VKARLTFYHPEHARSATVQLRTQSLFQRDANGELIHAPQEARSPQTMNPRAEERRSKLRFDWRHDAKAWTVHGHGRKECREARSCNLSRGGCCLLLDQAVAVGSFLDLQVEEADGCLPLLQVLEVRAKGCVWLVRCAWLQKLGKDKMRCLLGKPHRERKKSAFVTDRPPRPSWLMRLWLRFRAA
jgi:hypothetical protein